MSIYELKPKFQNLLRPLVIWLYQKGVTANQVTLITCVLSVLIGLGLYFANQPYLFYIIPIWFFIRMALNAVDGMLAREFNQKSQLGAYLNELTDVVSDAALYLPFVLIQPFTPLEIGLIIWLAALSEMLGVLGLALQGTRRYDGPMGKSDRAVVFSILALIAAWHHDLTDILFPQFFTWVICLIIVLLVITCYNRINRGLKDKRS